MSAEDTPANDSTEADHKTGRQNNTQKLFCAYIVGAAVTGFFVTAAASIFPYPITISGQKDSATSPIENQFVEMPADPSCACLEGHHSPIAISYNGTTYAGWLHSFSTGVKERIESKAILPHQNFEYYIIIDNRVSNGLEYLDPSWHHQAFFNSSKYPHESKNTTPPKKLVVEKEIVFHNPYLDTDRLVLPIVGKPFALRSVNDFDYEKAKKDNSEMWESIIATNPTYNPDFVKGFPNALDSEAAHRTKFMIDLHVLPQALIQLGGVLAVVHTALSRRSR